LLIEIHPEPDRAMSDGAQSLDFAAFSKLIERLKLIAAPLGTKLG
jgi:3-deoxy-7-phosphoheptulonate synthase